MADVSFFKIDFHATQLARDLLGRKAFSKQADNQLESLIARHQLSGRTADFSTFTSKSLGMAGCIARVDNLISSQLAADGGRTAPRLTGNFALADVPILPDLNKYAFFNTKFGIRYRRTLPEIDVLHSIFTAVDYFRIIQS